MAAGRNWGVAARIAVRETRASFGRFIFALAAVALGVGAMVGVRGFSRSFHTLLLAQARTLIAGDIMVRAPAAQLQALTQEQQAALVRLRGEGVRWTRITESVSMVASRVGADPILASLKAVDPRRYPFAGVVLTQPPGALARLDARSVLASPGLLLRAGLKPGESLRVGGAAFRIAGVDVSEPDRLAGGLSIGPRLLLTPGGLRRAGIVVFGSQASARLVFARRPGAPPLAVVEAALRRAFPHARIADARHVNPTVQRGLDHATTFLSLISLVALLIGALGVANAMHAHLQWRMDTIATLKVVGARGGQILRIYGLQTLGLGIAGGGMGLLVGALVALAFPPLLAPFFPHLPPLNWSWGPAGEGWLAGILVTLLFTLPPLLAARRLRPALILRRHMAAAGGARARWEAALAGAVLLAGVAALALVLAGGGRLAPRIAGYFLAGLVAGCGLLAALGWLLLRLLRGAVERWAAAGRPPAALRHGLANLYRPGSQSLAILTTLGLGVMLALSVFLLQRAVLLDLQRGTPPGVANVFLIDIPSAQQGAVLRLLGQTPEREAAPELLGTVPARLDRRRGVRLASVAAVPGGLRVTAGHWWPGVRPASPQLAVNRALAARLGLRLGQRVAISAGGENFAATVVALYRPEPQRLLARVGAFLSPGALAGIPREINGGVRLAPGAIPAFERVMFERFPAITVVNLADIIERVQQVVGQVTLVIHFVSFFAILAAAIVLASAVAGTRYRRLREIALLKTCGATRAAVGRMLSVEFALLGLVAGTAGALLAFALSSLLARRLLGLSLQVSLRAALAPAAAAVAGGVVLAMAAGWLAAAPLLGQKPLSVLRGE